MCVRACVRVRMCICSKLLSKVIFRRDEESKYISLDRICIGFQHKIVVFVLY